MNLKQYKTKEFIGFIIGATISAPFMWSITYQVNYPEMYPTWLTIDLGFIGLPIMSICLYVMCLPIYKSDGSGGETIRRLSNE